MATVTDAQIAAIPGWFTRLDVAAFRTLLAATAATGPGDLAELGVYLGKSAILLGSALGPGETLTVIDLFEDEPDDAHNARENVEQYSGLTKSAFEANYRAVHGNLPTIIRGESATITDHATAGNHRFVHIDASHLYSLVQADIAAARTLLRPDGVVVFDDYQSPHTPGVAAAMWQAVAEGLKPFLLTSSKAYGTWGDTAPYHAAVQRWLDLNPGVLSEQQEISGLEVTRVWPKANRLVRLVPPVAAPTLRRLTTRWRSLG